MHFLIFIIIRVNHFGIQSLLYKMPFILYLRQEIYSWPWMPVMYVCLSEIFLSVYKLPSARIPSWIFLTQTEQLWNCEVTWQFCKETARRSQQAVAKPDGSFRPLTWHVNKAHLSFNSHLVTIAAPLKPIIQQILSLSRAWMNSYILNWMAKLDSVFFIVR